MLALGIERAREQFGSAAVEGLRIGKLFEPVDRLAIVAELELDHAFDLHRRRHAFQRASGLLHQGARQIVAPRARREHGLQEIAARVVRLERDDLPRRLQHRAHPAHIAQRRGIFAEHGGIIGVDRQRALEPWQGGSEPGLAARQFTAQLQGADIAGVERNRMVGCFQPARLIARCGAEARDIGPQQAVVGGKLQGPVERRARLVILTERQMRPPLRARGIAHVRLGHRSFTQPAQRIAGPALQHHRLGHRRADKRAIGAEFERALELALGPIGIEQRQEHPRLREPRLLHLRRGLDRIHQLDPRRAIVTARTIVGSARHRLARRAHVFRAQACARAAQQQGSGGKRRPQPVAGREIRSGCHIAGADHTTSGG